MTETPSRPEAVAEPPAEHSSPDYRFPSVEAATAEVPLALLPFPGAPDGFSGTLEQLLTALRQQTFGLDQLPLASLIDHYLRFREGLTHDEAQERVSDFLPLAATLIQLKSRLFLRQLKSDEAQTQAAREEIVDEIGRAERRRREAQAATAEPPAPAEEPPSRLTLLDLMVLLNEVRNSLRAPLEVSEQDLSVREAMRWLRESLPDDAALSAESYFEQCRTRRDQAAVFLAALELSRHRFLDCQQAEAFSPLWLQKGLPAEHGTS